MSVSLSRGGTLSPVTEQYSDITTWISSGLLPTGSEERGVLGLGSVPVAVLLSCQDMKTIALKLLNVK